VSDLPIGLGCIRLSTDPDRDEDRAIATLHAALDAGVDLLDTAAAYGHGEGDEHHNERWIAQALATWSGDASRVRIVTKGGLVRRGVAYVPDGRQKSLRSSCEASLAALGRPIDLFLLHAPDPKTPFETSVRALDALVRDGLVRAVGLSNVSLPQLERARAETEIAAVEVALGAFDDARFRSGLVRRCVALGIAVLAHSPLGGPKRAPRLGRDPVLAESQRSTVRHLDRSSSPGCGAWESCPCPARDARRPRGRRRYRFPSTRPIERPCGCASRRASAQPSSPPSVGATPRSWS
jgi:aryl-alcohol dehydrogenase-like predicted oxidoreductase